MDNLIAVSEKIANSSEDTPIDEKKFVAYMRELPIWNFFRMNQSTYLSQPEEEKARLIAEYYRSMSEGNKDMFFLVFFVVVWKLSGFF